MKKRLTETIAEAADLPKDLVMDMPRITLAGNRDILIENYKGIKKYLPDTVLLAEKYGSVEISGHELSISDLSKDSIRITGNIMSVSFIRDEKHAKSTKVFDNNM